MPQDNETRYFSLPAPNDWLRKMFETPEGRDNFKNLYLGGNMKSETVHFAGSHSGECVVPLNNDRRYTTFYSDPRRAQVRAEIEKTNKEFAEIIRTRVDRDVAEIMCITTSSQEPTTLSLLENMKEQLKMAMSIPDEFLYTPERRYGLMPSHFNCRSIISFRGVFNGEADGPVFQVEARPKPKFLRKIAHLPRFIDADDMKAELLLTNTQVWSESDKMHNCLYGQYIESMEAGTVAAYHITMQGYTHGFSLNLELVAGEWREEDFRGYGNSVPRDHSRLYALTEVILNWMNHAQREKSNMVKIDDDIRSSGRSDLVDIHADIRAETEKAYCISRDGSESIWVPKSQVEFDGNGTFTMPEWLATDKGLV